MRPSTNGASSLSRVSTCAFDIAKQVENSGTHNDLYSLHYIVVIIAIIRIRDKSFVPYSFPSSWELYSSTRWESGWIMIREQTEIFSREIDKLL